MSSESETIKDALAQYSKTLLPLQAIAKTKPNNPDALDALEKALEQLPPSDRIGAAIEEQRRALQTLVSSIRGARVEEFRRGEAEFVRAAREAGTHCREQNEGWRIGPLSWQFRRSESKARVLYNHEVLIDWEPIVGAEGFARLESRAIKQLESAAMSDELLTSVFWAAYNEERTRREAQNASKPGVIPILDFYRAVRASLTWHELLGQRPDRRLKFGELCRWQFLYNLDRYRSLSRAMPADRRLSFQTGSQQQDARGQCVTVNGLEADGDYKTMCFVAGPAAVQV